MKRFFKSFEYAWNGITSAFSGQMNLKIFFGVAVAVIVLGFYFQVTTAEWIILILCIGSTISLELINTAIENLVDLVTTERKPLAGKIKDIAAGAVLVATLTSILVGSIIFYTYIFD